MLRTRARSVSFQPLDRSKVVVARGQHVVGHGSHGPKAVGQALARSSRAGPEPRGEHRRRASAGSPLWRLGQGWRRGRRQVSPWTLGGLSVRRLAALVWAEIRKDELLDRAAALSYYFVFALFPTLLFLTTLIGMLPGPDLMERFLAPAQDLLPPDVASLLARTLAEVQQGAGSGLLSIGAAAALWGASRGMVSIITTLNVVYGVTSPRPWWRRQLAALALTVVFSVLALAALLSVVFGERVGQAAAAWAGLGGVVHGRLESPPVAARRPVRPHGDRSRLPPRAGRPPALVLAHARIRLRGRRLGGGLARPPRLRQPVRELQRDVRLDRRRDPAPPVAVPLRPGAPDRRRGQLGDRAGRRRARRGDRGSPRRARRPASPGSADPAT